jgi:hypothetical protein
MILICEDLKLFPKARNIQCCVSCHDLDPDFGNTLAETQSPGKYSRYDKGKHTLVYCCNFTKVADFYFHNRELPKERDQWARLIKLKNSNKS